MNDCKLGGKHIWVGTDGGGWECKSCGVLGRDCPDCDGTGWYCPPSGEVGDEDCETCKGEGVVPAKEASDGREA